MPPFTIDMTSDTTNRNQYLFYGNASTNIFHGGMNCLYGVTALTRLLWSIATYLYVF